MTGGAPQGVPSPLPPRRQRLLEVITREPGIDAGALGRTADVPYGTLRHHLRVLERDGLIVGRKVGRIRRFFGSRGRHGAAWQAWAVLRDPHLRLLHAALRKRPRSRADAALDAFIAWGWSRSTAYHRLSRLEASGLLEKAADGERLRALDVAEGEATARGVEPPRPGPDGRTTGPGRQGL